MDFTEFIKPELLVLVPVLIIIGKILKDSIKVDSTKIPLYLGIIGIALSCLWVLCTSPLDSPKDVLLAIFASIVQGILCAGAAVYGNQLIKQNSIRKINKEKESEEENTKDEERQNDLD